MTCMLGDVVTHNLEWSVKHDLSKNYILYIENRIKYIDNKLYIMSILNLHCL